MLRLTFERQKRGWTKFYTGSMSKIHPVEIGRLESGRMKPYPGWINRLEKLFDIPGEELFKEVE